MLVEAKKRFEYGFVLNEQDLRRTIDVVIEQYQKLSTSPKPTIAYEIKYKNGAISKTDSLESVFNQENLGSSQIIKLVAVFEADLDGDCISVNIGFNNADLNEDPGTTSIWYNIQGNSRDWVFISSSLIQERIEKIKRFCPNQLGISGKRSSPIRALLPLILMLVMFIPIILISESSQVSTSSLLIEAKDKGELVTTIDALILIEQARESRSSIFGDSFSSIISYGLVGIVSLIGIFVFLLRYYPVYNFIWGDYSEHFKKTEGIRKFILIIVLLGIIVSFVGGILANMTGIN
jgi:hypothetical protein